MTTSLDLDLATLVGEMEDVPCENGYHDFPEDRAVHDGPATEYCRINCPGCESDLVKAYCAPFVAYIRANMGVHCPLCGFTYAASRGVTILGPVNGRAS